MDDLMDDLMDDAAARQGIARLERLLGELEELADEAARATALEAVRALVAVYGAGLARVLAHAADAGAEAVARACADDELVAHLLLVHGLHPDDVAVRVRRALEGVRPALRSHGGDVELLAVEGGAVRLRLRGGCDGCAASATTLRTTIEEAVRAAAPDIDRIEAEGERPAGPGAAAAPPGRTAFVPLSAVGGHGGRAR